MVLSPAATGRVAIRNRDMTRRHGLVTAVSVREIASAKLGKRNAIGGALSRKFLIGEGDC